MWTISIVLISIIIIIARFKEIHLRFFAEAGQYPNPNPRTTHRPSGHFRPSRGRAQYSAARNGEIPGGRGRSGRRNLDFERPLDERQGRRGSKARPEIRTLKRKEQSRSKRRGRTLSEAARHIRLETSITPSKPAEMDLETDVSSHLTLHSAPSHIEASHNESEITQEGQEGQDASEKHGEGIIDSLNDAAGAVNEEEERKRQHDAKMEEAAKEAEDKKTVK